MAVEGKTGAQTDLTAASLARLQREVRFLKAYATGLTVALTLTRTAE